MKYRACIPSARFDPFERRLFEDGRPIGREVNEASWASSDRWEKEGRVREEKGEKGKRAERV